MLSIYIHIPFCNRKCEYCNFVVIAKDNPNWQDTMIDQYLTALHAEIDLRSSLSPNAQISTIYVGGGTPGILSLTQITGIINHIERVWDCSNIAELSIELNPDPFDHTLALVRGLSDRYRHFPRVRCSFGIQTFDDAVLIQAGRDYVFNSVRHFLRDLRSIKQAHNVFNLDFIAFGTRDKRTIPRKEFLQAMISSYSFDSYSLYLLELFPGSKRHSLLKNTSLSPLLTKLVNPDEDAIMSEYDAIATMLYQAGYTQYEVSNRALSSKDSIHNHVYRNMDSYLGLGISASGLVHNLPEQILGEHSHHSDNYIRYTNTSNISNYIKGDYQDHNKTVELSSHDYYIELLMLGLRTNHGISYLTKYEAYLTVDWEILINTWTETGLARYESDTLVLTHEGMKIANYLISDLLDFQTP